MEINQALWFDVDSAIPLALAKQKMIYSRNRTSKFYIIGKAKLKHRTGFYAETKNRLLSPKKLM